MGIGIPAWLDEKTIRNIFEDPVVDLEATIRHVTPRVLAQWSATTNLRRTLRPDTPS